ncbi:hypothetical protein IAT38_003386 [Cryptococcus sp. DSM 104549]
MRVTIGVLCALGAGSFTSAVSLGRFKTGLGVSREAKVEPTFEVTKRANTTSDERWVFAHFMVGFVNSYTQEDWTRDVALAASKGIDGFALNCDGQDTNQQQLTYAFQAASASSAPFKLFISPDFVHFSYSDPAPVSAFLKPWVTEDAYFQYEGKPFVSSFWGEGTDWEAVTTSVGTDLYVVPFYYASQAAAETKGVNGLFSWEVWPGESTDDVVNQNMTTDPDKEYLDLLAPLGKTYMAPVSPWFYAHLPASTGYPKNYYLYSDTLWPTRWQQILDLAVANPDQLKFVEIITWNDWTESSLISPYRGTMTTDGNEQWSKDFDHSALMDMMGPFIKAFKAGSGEVEVEENRIVWWYRPTLKDAECDATDTVGEKPRGADMAADSIFVAALTTGAATITVTSGSSTSSQTVDKAGVHTLAFPMDVGSVSFDMKVDGGGTASGKGAIEISAECYEGVYNFNILSGTAVADGSSSSSTTDTTADASDAASSSDAATSAGASDTASTGITSGEFASGDATATGAVVALVSDTAALDATATDATATGSITAVSADATSTEEAGVVATAPPETFTDTETISDAAPITTAAEASPTASAEADECPDEETDSSGTTDEAAAPTESVSATATATGDESEDCDDSDDAGSTEQAAGATSAAEATATATMETDECPDEEGDESASGTTVEAAAPTSTSVGEMECPDEEESATAVSDDVASATSDATVVAIEAGGAEEQPSLSAVANAALPLESGSAMFTQTGSFAAGPSASGGSGDWTHGGWGTWRQWGPRDVVV